MIFIIYSFDIFQVHVFSVLKISSCMHDSPFENFWFLSLKGSKRMRLEKNQNSVTFINFKSHPIAPREDLGVLDCQQRSEY